MCTFFHFSARVMSRQYVVARVWHKFVYLLSQEEQITTEYRARVLDCHPDKHPGDPKAGTWNALLRLFKFLFLFLTVRLCLTIISTCHQRSANIVPYPWTDIRLRLLMLPATPNAAWVTDLKNDTWGRMVGRRVVLLNVLRCQLTY